MNEIMDVLYNNFYNRPPAAQLRDEIEHCHQELIERPDKPVRRLVLQIIDCKHQDCKRTFYGELYCRFSAGVEAKSGSEYVRLQASNFNE